MWFPQVRYGTQNIQPEFHLQKQKEEAQKHDKYIVYELQSMYLKSHTCPMPSQEPPRLWAVRATSLESSPVCKAEIKNFT